MDTAVSSKTGRRRDATKENILYGSLTEEQQSRRLVFGETLWAGAFMALCFGVPRSQIPADMPTRRSLLKSKNLFSGNVHSFLTGCY
jgi:hypothetical protein